MTKEDKNLVSSGVMIAAAAHDTDSGHSDGATAPTITEITADVAAEVE